MPLRWCPRLHPWKTTIGAVLPTRSSTPASHPGIFFSVRRPACLGDDPPSRPMLLCRFGAVRGQPQRSRSAVGCAALGLPGSCWTTGSLGAKVERPGSTLGISPGADDAAADISGLDASLGNLASWSSGDPPLAESFQGKRPTSRGKTHIPEAGPEPEKPAQKPRPRLEATSNPAARMAKSGSG